MWHRQTTFAVINYRANRLRLGKLKRVWFALGLHDWCRKPHLEIWLTFHNWPRWSPRSASRPRNLRISESNLSLLKNCRAWADYTKKASHPKPSARSFRTSPTCWPPPPARPSTKYSVSGKTPSHSSSSSMTSSSPNDRATKMIHSNKLTFVIFIYFWGKNTCFWRQKQEAWTRMKFFIFKWLKFNGLQKEKWTAIICCFQ